MFHRYRLFIVLIAVYIRGSSWWHASSISGLLLPNLTTTAQYISGDIVSIQISYQNTGNVALNNASLSIDLPSFMSPYPSPTIISLGFLAINATGSNIRTWIVSRNGFIGWWLQICLNNDSTSLVCTTLNIQENIGTCWDNRVWGNETCDIVNGATRDINNQSIQPYQTCNSCQIQSDAAINTVILDYLWEGTSYWQSAQVPIYLTGVLPGVCSQLTTDSQSQYDTLPVNKQFVCKAAQYTPQVTTATLDCKNGQVFQWVVDQNGEYRASCTFSTGGIYNAQCLVWSETVVLNQCLRPTTIGIASPNVCGDGIVDTTNIYNTEECDLGTPDGQTIQNTIWKDRNGNQISRSGQQWRYQCTQCRISWWQPAQSPKCSAADTAISAQVWEIVPFWRDIDLTDTSTVSSANECGATDSQGRYINEGKVVISSMQCKFEVFNGINKRETINNVSQIWRNPFADRGWYTACNVDWRKGPDNNILPIFQYFQTNYFDNKSDYLLFNPWRYSFRLDDAALVNWNVWEYKISLEEVKYTFCRNGSATAGIPYPRVCQTNLAVTKPLLSQRWINMAGSSELRSDFYDIIGNNIGSQTNMNLLTTITANKFNMTRSLSSRVNTIVSTYKNQWTVSNGTAIGISATAGSTVKKVSGKNIRILESTSDKTFVFDDQNNLVDPFTIIIPNGNLIIKGDSSTAWMFLVPNGYIVFADQDNGCSINGVDAGSNQSLTQWQWKHERQVVNGIYISGRWFNGPKMANDNTQKNRCQEWWLTIRGIAVWPNLQNLANARRSELNSRFTTFDCPVTSDIAAYRSCILSERRKELFYGSSLLIDTNTAIRNNLPPLAIQLRDILNFYRQ